VQVRRDRNRDILGPAASVGAAATGNVDAVEAASASASVAGNAEGSREQASVQEEGKPLDEAGEGNRELHLGTSHHLLPQEVVTAVAAAGPDVAVVAGKASSAGAAGQATAAAALLPAWIVVVVLVSLLLVPLVRQLTASKGPYSSSSGIKQPLGRRLFLLLLSGALQGVGDLMSQRYRQRIFAGAARGLQMLLLHLLCGDSDE
jgi:hypothetical protein